MAPVDVLLVSLGATVGLRSSDAELMAGMQRAGATVALVAARRPRPVRTFALTDLGWARAAREAALIGLTRHRPRAVVYSTVTAALLWPRPGAVRFDALARVNRLGRHGVWQRPVERRRLATASLLIPTHAGVLTEAAVAADGAVLVPIAVEPSRELGAARRDLAAITYAADPVKKGLARVLAAWGRARHPGEELVVAGLEPERVAGMLGGEPAGAGVRAVGHLEADAYRALLRRARAYVCAPRREDYGLAQLEALADGCRLVTTPAPGAYAALDLARELDPRLVGDNLEGALRMALDAASGDYPKRALALLEPFRRPAVDAVIKRELLPRLLG